MMVEEALATIEALLGKESLNDLQKTVFRQSWERKSYPEIAKSLGYDEGYIKYVGFQLWKMLSVVLGDKITKNNFRSSIMRWQTSSSNGASGELQTSPAGDNIKTVLVENNTNCISNPNIECNLFCHQDWGEAIDVSVFYGRSTELATLEQWIIQERCRLIAILGIGGIGKTALSIKLAKKIQSQFEFVIWRSLHNVPSIESLLASLIQFLSNQQETDLPKDVNSRILRLIDYLRSSRCLLVLDNVETILCSSDNTLGALHRYCAGHYREGCEGYGELFKRIAELCHNSCLVITSREKPKEVSVLEGKTFSVRSLQLSGLTTADGQEILRAKGNFYGTLDDWQKLIQYYAGNPLALKIVSTIIRDLFDSNISQFIAQGTGIFGEIKDLFDQQFYRLSILEKEIMYWLTIAREPVTIKELQADILSPILPDQLLEALASLERRSMIERRAVLFTLQPLIMEYVTNRLVKEVYQEIENQKVFLFKNHALLKAQAKDYIKTIQIYLLIKPIIYQLLRTFGAEKIDSQLMEIISSLRCKPPIETGYAAGNTINLLRQLKFDLSGHDFSNITVWQADLEEVNLHGVNFSCSDLAKSTFTKKFSSILSVAASPDGNLLATGDTQGQICIQQVTNGQQIFLWDEHTGWVRSVAFSSNGQTLISGGDDQTIRLWNVNTGQCFRILHGHNGGIWSVAISPQSDNVASGGEDRTVKVWDINSGQCLRTLQGHRGWVWSVAFSPQGKILASGSEDRTVKVWDINSGQCLRTLQGHKDIVSSVTFSADGQTLASSGAEQMVRVWDVNTGQCLKILQGHTGWVCSVAFSSDNNTLASSSTDRTIKLWDINTGQQVRTLQGHSSAIRSICFSSDGQTLISSDEDKTVKMWEVSTGQCFRTFRGYSSGVWSIAFNPQNKTLASCSADQIVRIWDVSTGQCLRTLKNPTNWGSSVAFSPDGQTLANGGADQMVRIWDVRTGQCLKTLKGHTGWIPSVAFSPDGQTLASGSADQAVRIWDVRTGQCLRLLSGQTSLVFSVAYSPDGKTLAVGSADQMVRVWDASTGKCLKVLQGHTNWVCDVAVSPQGKTLASGGADQIVRVWDASTGECLRTLKDHTNWVRSVAYSPDGRTLASGSADQTVRIWDARTGQCLRVLQGHINPVYSIAFTDCGQIIVSGSEDQTIRFWDIEKGKCLKILRSERPYEDMNITGVVGLTEIQKVTLKALGAWEHL
jgi:WD40 repeat protein